MMSLLLLLAPLVSSCSYRYKLWTQIRLVRSWFILFVSTEVHLVNAADVKADNILRTKNSGGIWRVMGVNGQYFQLRMQGLRRRTKN